MAKVVLDIIYPESEKDKYEKFILKLENEGWKLEHISVDCRKGRGKYHYRTMLRHVI